MTFDERVQAVAKRGFTERQARFLTTVMLHAGVCVHASTRGSAASSTARRRGSSSPSSCGTVRVDVRLPPQPRAHLPRQPAGALRGHRRGRQPLRRPLTLNRAIQRLMVLDAIVEDPDLVWLATADEKAAHLTALTAIAPTDLPHVTVGDGDAAQGPVLPGAPADRHPPRRPRRHRLRRRRPGLDDFRVFLERHAALLRALPAWTLRIVVPPQFPDIGSTGQQVVMEPADDAAQARAPLDELRWYFEQLRASHHAEARPAVLTRVRPSRAAVQGAVQALEAGRRRRSRRPGSAPQRCRGGRRRPNRDA
jgi:hypothetical protein